MSSKYDNMMKCAQVRSLANEKQYRNAYEVIQTINIDQITAITDLNTIADVYIQLQKYAEAKSIYLKLYERFPTRRVVYQLVYLSLKCGEIEEAEEYYSEYETLDKSGDRIILRYYIDKAKGVGRQTLIRYLQELKRVDYMEEWAYELAKLYHKEGMSAECVEECSDIILWFGEGLIVEKAMLLKHHYMDGADISSESAIIEETRNLAAELRIAAAIAERNEREAAQKAAEEEADREQADREAELLYVKPKNRHSESAYAPVYTDRVYYEEKVEEYVEEQVQEVQVILEEEVYAEQPVQEEEQTLVEAVSVGEEITEETTVETVGADFVQEEQPVCAEELPETIEEAEVEEPVNYDEADREETMEAATDEAVEEIVEDEQTEYEDSFAEDAEVREEESQLFEGGFSEVETALAEIVADIKKTKSTGHIAITGSNSEKNIEIGKCLAKELLRQQILPTSKIARISAASLNGINLMDNRQQLEGGCLLIEEASEMTLDSVQSLYQLMRKTKGNMVVVLSDTEDAIEYMLRKHRKLSKWIEYHIEV